jgi:hypothetical protein
MDDNTDSTTPNLNSEKQWLLISKHYIDQPLKFAAAFGNCRRLIADVNSENSLSRRHFFADVNKFYDIGKKLFIIDGEARLLIILIGKKYILTIVPKTHDVQSKDANLFRFFRLFNSLQSEPLITNVFVLPQAKR